MIKEPFVLDTNILIEAARRYYAFDLAPGFWQKMLVHANKGRVMSIDRVNDELQRGKDDVAEWASKQFSHAFMSTAQDTIYANYREIITWVYAQDRFRKWAVEAFAACADG